MKKALIVIALVLILLCSLAVSGIPFNLVVGKEGSKSKNIDFDPQLYYPFEFSKNVFIGEVRADAFRDFNECKGSWFAEVYNSGMLIDSSSDKNICTYDRFSTANTRCWRSYDFGFVSADSVVFRTKDLQDRVYSGWWSNTWNILMDCNSKINMNPRFIEGRKYPFAVSSKSGAVRLGTVDELLDNYFFTETSGSDFKIDSDNPRVLVWIGGESDHNLLLTKTSSSIEDVWACYDGDQNMKCDFAENDACASKNGDYFQGVCCGVDVPEGFVSEWNGKSVNALCARITANNWVWVDANNVGEIFNLDYYPVQSIVSDGQKFVSCSGEGPGGIAFKEYLVIEDDSASCSPGYFNAFSETGAFTVCANFDGAVIKQGTDEEGSSGFEPAACDSGYAELGVFVHDLAFNREYKFRVCAPVSPSSQGSASSQFIRISTKYGNHSYLCLADKMFECSGGRPFSTNSVAALGSNSTSLSGFFCPAGMIAYWSFDSDSGNSVADVKGVASGVSNDVSFASSRIGKAARFDSPLDDIEITHSSVNLALPNIALEAWIYPSSIAGKHTIINKEYSYELYMDSGVLKASLYSDGSPGSVFLSASHPVTPGIWSHVALVYDGSAAKLYHNGQNVASSSFTGKIKSSNYSLMIGARSLSPVEPFDGLIDEVALYSNVLSQGIIQSHYSNQSSYCGVVSIPDVYYCASDGDWTEDLDVKDELSCSAAGFSWTGHKCCSEFDDPDESYSDSSSPAVDISGIMGDSKNINVSGKSVLLDSSDSFAVIRGPARISVVRSSFQKDMRGDIIFCEDKEVSSFDLLDGQSKRIVNYNYPNSANNCDIGQTVVSSLPTLAQGGCFNKKFYPSGSFLYEKSVINANGEFVACMQSPAGLQQYSSVIRTQSSPCGSPINDVFPGQAAVCLPSGRWHFIGNADETSIAQTSWDPANFNITAYRQGCCPSDKCWNGTGCQSADTYYSIESSGFVCK